MFISHVFTIVNGILRVSTLIYCTSNPMVYPYLLLIPNPMSHSMSKDIVRVD